MLISTLALLQLLVTVLARASGDLYAADPNIYELTPANFDKVVYRSNYTAVVEFYAPWCGYCKQLEPVWRKMARFFAKDGKYAVTVASVNCDKESNKALCSQHRVQGFPTVIVFRPPKWSPGQVKTGRHVPDRYNGERALAPMVEFTTSRIKNYVKRFLLVDTALGRWLAAADSTPKVVLLSAAKSASPLYKTMAVDFLSSLSLGMVSLSNPPVGAVVTVEGQEVPLPVSEGDSLPILLVYKPEKKEFVRYTGGKLKDKTVLEKWLIDQTGAVPGEGSLSKKYKKHTKYRVRDEL